MHNLRAEEMRMETALSDDGDDDETDHNAHMLTENGGSHCMDYHCKTISATTAPSSEHPTKYSLTNREITEITTCFIY